MAEREHDAVPDLIAELSALPSSHRLAFAASCCERLLPLYGSFSREEDWGYPDLLRDALDGVWQLVKGARLSEERIRRWRRGCRTITPDPGRFPSPEAAEAARAVEAVSATLECAVTGDAATAARVVEGMVDRDQRRYLAKLKARRHLDAMFVDDLRRSAQTAGPPLSE